MFKVARVNPHYLSVLNEMFYPPLWKIFSLNTGLFRNFILYMFVDFYARGAGRVCDNEDDIIRSKEDCSRALSDLDFDVSGNYWTDSGANMAKKIPSGCSIRKGGDKRPHLL